MAFDRRDDPEPVGRERDQVALHPRAADRVDLDEEVTSSAGPARVNRTPRVSEKLSPGRRVASCGINSAFTATRPGSEWRRSPRRRPRPDRPAGGGPRQGDELADRDAVPAVQDLDRYERGHGGPPVCVNRRAGRTGAGVGFPGHGVEPTPGEPEQGPEVCPPDLRPDQLVVSPPLVRVGVRGAVAGHVAQPAEGRLDLRRGDVPGELVPVPLGDLRLELAGDHPEEVPVLPLVPEYRVDEPGDLGVELYPDAGDVDEELTGPGGVLEPHPQDRHVVEGDEVGAGDPHPGVGGDLRADRGEQPADRVEVVGGVVPVPLVGLLPEEFVRR